MVSLTSPLVLSLHSLAILDSIYGETLPTLRGYLRPDLADEYVFLARWILKAVGSEDQNLFTAAA